MFRKQFFGKLTWQVALIIALVHVLAIGVRGSGLELPTLVIIGLITLVATYRSLPHGLMLAFTEIFIGGHGHLIETSLFGFSLSLRIVIFAAVMLAFAVLFVTKKVSFKFNSLRDVPWLLLLSAIALGTVIGFAQNDISKAFDDMNGYLTILYFIPVIAVKWDQKLKRELLQILSASVVWLVFFTLLLSFLFTHLDGKTLSHVYTFVRDSRLAEITLQTVSNDNGGITNSLGAKLVGQDGYWYRIFMQSQLFVVIGLSVLFSSMMIMWRNQKLPDLIAISAIGAVAASLLSMSRSFALGIIAATGVIWLTSFSQGKNTLFNITKRSIGVVILSALGFGLALVTVIFPFPAQPDIQEAAFYSTSADTDREVAVSSRWSLLQPMMDDIWTSPVLGSGFGHEVTYTSDDPRVRSVYEDGVVTTYRFEWGYQDLWLKMGAPGLIAFAWYAMVMFMGIRFTMKNHGHGWLVLGLGGGLIVLFVSNVFSPYLNHPIGLAYMVFVIPFIDFAGMEKKRVANKSSIISIKKRVPEMSPAMSKLK